MVRRQPATLSLAGMTVQVTPPQRPDAVERAVAGARAADVAVVVVGHDAAETEGLDHSTIDLPPDQVELIRQVRGREPRDGRRGQRRLAGQR